MKMPRAAATDCGAMIEDHTMICTKATDRHPPSHTSRHARLAPPCQRCGRSRILASGRLWCPRCQRAPLMAVLRAAAERVTR